MEKELKQNKKETLEEAAERLYPGVDRQVDRMLFINGAKWQQERSYSEEDLREAFRNGQENMDYSEMYGLDSDLTEQQWFEEFKKK